MNFKSLFFLPLLFAHSAFSQDCDKVWLNGKVKDTIRPQGFYNMMIVNRTTGKGIFGQPNGSFSLYVTSGDSISISVKGYPMINFTVKEDGNCQYSREFIIEGEAQKVQEVVVYPIKSLAQIKEERESLALRETRQVTGIEVLQSPITALYQAFSKKEQSKRWVAEQEYKDDQRRIVKELLRTYVAYDVVNLSEEEFDEFLYFLNISPDFIRTATEFELINFIQGKFEHYKRLKEETR